MLHDVAQYYKFDVLESEIEYQKYLAGTLGDVSSETHNSSRKSCEKESSPKSNLAKEIEKAREKIKSLNTNSGATAAASSPDIDALQSANRDLRAMVEALTLRVQTLESTVASMQKGSAAAVQKSTAPAPTAVNGDAKKAGGDEDEDDDIDNLFDDDEDDEEANAEFERVRQERLKEYYAKKEKKPVIIAKSNIILDVKPWDDETDMGDMERKVRSVEMDGLLWGSAKLVPVGYGIKKLQISCVVEDDKVGTDDLEESITAFEDLVQSVDVVAFNKI